MLESARLQSPHATAVNASLAVPTGGCVHVWQFDTGQTASRAALTWLSLDEMARANRFRHASDRSRYLSRRAMLRRIVADYCNVAPHALKLSVGCHGKPVLPDRALSFSSAFADNRAVIAVAAADMTVGIDIERVRDDFDWKAIAAIAFNPAEIAWIEQQRHLGSAFTQVWACREAMFKAWGKGLHDSMPVTSLIRDGKLSCPVSDPDGASWWFTKLATVGDYHAALAGSLPLSHVEIMPSSVMEGMQCPT
jgi:4'-phosphopantetheinyl transferase